MIPTAALPPGGINLSVHDLWRVAQSEPLKVGELAPIPVDFGEG